MANSTDEQLQFAHDTEGVLMGVFGSQGATAAPLCDSAVSEAGGSLRQRSPEDDDHDHVAPDSSRCHGDMHHKYDRRADLDRMTSRRTFSMVPPDNAQQGGDKYGQQVRRRFSRGGHRPGARSGGNPSMDPANEVDGMATEKVLDFFRQVNKDAHQLKRMGSNGMYGCCSRAVGVFAGCLRKIGVGNPGASVENIVFNGGDSWNKSVHGRRSSGTDCHDATASGRASQRALSIDTDGVLFEEDEEEDDTEATQKEIIQQKKKVNALGELPALDWTFVTRNLLLSIAACGILLLTTVPNDSKCVNVHELCLRTWCYALCVAIGAYFAIELFAKCLAGFFKWTRLLHTNNYVWIFIKLHKRVSLCLWSTMIYSLLRWLNTTKWDFPGGDEVAKLLSCFLALNIVRLVKDYCQVEMAHQYMWTPYLARARESIWSQYVFFMLTDFAMGVETKDAEGQALALSFTRSRIVGENMSLYTVGKAIGFVHANALKHPLGPGRPGTDAEGMIESKTGARLFGALLFDALMVRKREKADAAVEESEKESLLSGGKAIAAVYARQRQSEMKARMNEKPDESTLPRPFDARPSDGGRGNVVEATHGNGIQSPLRRQLSPVGEQDEDGSRADIFGEECKEESKWHSNGSDHEQEEGRFAPLATAALSGVLPSPKVIPQEERDPKRNVSPALTSATPSPRLPSLGSAPTPFALASPQNPGGRVPAPKSTVIPATKPPPNPTHRRGGSGAASSLGTQHRRLPSANKNHTHHDGITLAVLRQMTNKTIALKIMELFEVAPDEGITRKAFIDRMVDVFVQRRSLQLTLGDYEAILKKVGYLLSVVGYVVVFFVALRIFGYNIGNLVLTWLSLAVAFSFLFGSSASAFFESIIYVFVTKAYDVGDPVYFVDDSGREDWYIVTRINMLTTVFRRWDGQATLLPNNVLAKKVLRNQWRSGPLLHNTTLAIAIDTPMEKLEQMRRGVAAGMRRGNLRHSQGVGGLLPDTVDYQFKGITDGNRLAIFVMCRQRTNGSNMGRRFANGSVFVKLITQECTKLGISYTMPNQPVSLRGGLEILRQREAFLGGDEGGQLTNLGRGS